MVLDNQSAFQFVFKIHVKHVNEKTKEVLLQKRHDEIIGRAIGKDSADALKKVLANLGIDDKYEVEVLRGETIADNLLVEVVGAPKVK